MEKTIKGSLKYGFQGLVAEVFSIDGSRKLAEITLSKDTEKIFKFLDFDYEHYTKGFDTLEEIFHWVIASKYFVLEKFQMENLNHIDRKRNAKRSTYQAFLEYANANKIQSSGFKFNKDKDSYIDMIDEFFPEANFKKTLTELKIKDERNRLAAETFNGDRMMEITGKTGRELGIIIQNFKKFLEEKHEITYNDAILVDENIEETFTNFYKSFATK
jgi:hypothetical protein